MQRSNLIILLSANLMFIFCGLFFWTNIYENLESYSVYFQSDIELFTSYLFKTHQHYMFLSIFLLLMALFLSVFLSTKYLGSIKTELRLYNYE